MLRTTPPRLRSWVPLVPLLGALALTGCSGSDSNASPPTSDDGAIAQGMHDALLGQIQALHAAAADLQAAAPVADRGWDATADADAVASMTAAWIRARSAYEHVEGALAPIFPDLDFAIDARYDDFLERLGPAGDGDLFDGEGVTGMHAVERILYAPQTSADVVALESSLPGYEAARWPATADEAKELRSELCAKLVADTADLVEQWTPARIDVAGAFQGLVALMNEQREKVNKASTAEEESRYARRTLADLRDNLAGTRTAFALFEPLLRTKPDGTAIDADVLKAFDALDAAYGAVPGDAIPTPPATWSAEQPSAADLDTPFGRLYRAVNDAVDPNRPGSAVFGMNRAAVALGFPELAN